ncbi:MAG: sulfotransferase family 2 domain-containing protein [Alteromonadaceae bacterium]|nr:sulfotransferase family 2 domain-containing protein [Alteromonadaceae bacterium]
MLLSHKYQFLFVHIAKTGGTSVRDALSSYRWDRRYGIAQFIVNKLSQLCGHKLGCRFPRHSKVIAAKEMLPADYFAALYKFAFVRNPWDLQVSSYHHILRERPGLLAGCADFDSFMRFKLDPERCYQYHIDTSMQLQTDYLIDLQGNLCLDFIARYETLQDDFNAICTHLKLPIAKLPHKRQANDRDSYHRYYSDELAELVALHFKRDIEMLGYSF